MHPIIFEFEQGTVYSYGVCRVLSYVVAAALLVVTAKKLSEPLAYAARAIAAMVVGGLLGGRLGFVLLNWREPWASVGQIFNFSAGYLAFTGFIGGGLALVAVSIVKRRPVGTAFDLVTPSLVGAWAVGNIGCFLAGCCVGAPTTLPWGLRFSADSTPPELRGMPAHPAQLYSLLFELAVMGGLYRWPRRFPGHLFLRGLVALLVMRIGLAVGGVRPGGSSASTVFFVVLALIAAGLLIVFQRMAARQAPMEPPLSPKQHA